MSHRFFAIAPRCTARYMRAAAALAGVLGLSGCAGQAAISGLGTTINSLDQPISQIAGAPLAACTAIIQQAQMQLGALATGTVVPPALAPSPAPVATPPVTAAPASAPVTTAPSAPPAAGAPPSPIVTPLARPARHRVSQNVERPARPTAPAIWPDGLASAVVEAPRPAAIVAGPVPDWWKETASAH